MHVLLRVGVQKTKPHGQATHLRHDGRLDGLRSRLGSDAASLASWRTVPRAALLTDRNLLIITADGMADRIRVNGAMAEEEESSPDRLREDIKDAVEDHLAVRSDDVAALRKAPADGVQVPEEDDPDGADDVGAADSWADGGGVAAAEPEEVDGEEEEREDADHEVAPFVRRGDDGAGQPGHDHDFGQEPGVQDRGPWGGGREEEGEDDELGRGLAFEA